MSFINQTFMANVDWYSGVPNVFVGNTVQGVGYYQGQGSLQTITADVTDFTGNINFQASLNDPLSEAVFFDVTNTGDLTNVTSILSFTVTGNFVWMVAEVLDFASGNINSITITY